MNILKEGNSSAGFVKKFSLTSHQGLNITACNKRYWMLPYVGEHFEILKVGNRSAGFVIKFSQTSHQGLNIANIMNIVKR